MQSASLTLAIQFLASFAISTFAAEWQEANGLVSMEAEHATRIKGWIPISGGSNDTTMVDNGARGSGYMAFDITFAKTGTYIVWVKNVKDALKDGTCASDACNDCFADMDGSELTIYEGSACNGHMADVMGLGTHATSLTWQSRPKTECVSDRSGKHVAFTISTPGMHTFTIDSRSKKYGIDKLVFMHEDLKISKPSGDGPAETPGTTNTTVLWPITRKTLITAHQNPSTVYDVIGRLTRSGHEIGRRVDARGVVRGLYIQRLPSGPLRLSIELK